MHHAGSRQGVAAQVHSQLVMGAAGVEDHRQIVAFRQRQLRVEDRRLAVKLRIVTIQIEADLADGDQLCRTAGCLRRGAR